MSATTADKIEYLLTTVGPRITAAGAGLADARPLARWRTGQDAPSDVLTLQRIGALYGVVQAVTRDYDGSIAAAFLRGSNPELDGDAPLMVIREADNLAALSKARDRVGDAVRAFMD